MLSGNNGAVFTAISENFTYLRNFFGEGIGLIETKNELYKNNMQIGLIYIDSVTDDKLFRDHILSPLIHFTDELSSNPDDALTFMQSHIISVADTQITSDMAQVISKLLNGYTVLFINEATSALLIGSRKVKKKAVETPENEATVLGSQESFTDDLQTNTSLIIKRLPVPGLHFAQYTVGTLSQTKVKLIWLEGVANPSIIEEAKCRINKIEYDNIDGIGVLAQLIEDKPVSLFPKYRQTERPDTAAKSLTDGRFVIICDNSPFALLAPIMMWDNFKSMDDYEDRPMVGSYLRMVRYIAFMLSTLISSLYLSFVTYNHAIVPPSLAINIAMGREGVPFPTIVELLFLTLAITIIREAGLRMPQSVSYFVGTLAAVIIGQAIVTAGYVSPSLIIVVAISTIASFAISTTTLLYPARLLNYFFILLAGFFGIFGVINGLVIVFWHLASLSSFGIPYLYPVLPFDIHGFKDVFVRFPFRTLNKRMKRLSPNNRVRSGKSNTK